MMKSFACRLTRALSLSACAVLLAAGGPASLRAEDKPAAPAAAAEPEMTPEEKAERDGRKACKVAICSAFHNRKPGDDLACSVLKSWRKSHLDRMISKAQVSWPYGAIKCTADIKLKREALAKAMTEDKYEAQLDKHSVSCTVALEKDGPAEIKFDFTPKVTFEKGKATKANLNWGKIEAPMLVKGAMWTVTATDNTFNVLQSTMVDDINEFIGAKCDEVKDEWAGK